MNLCISNFKLKDMGKFLKRLFLYSISSLLLYPLLLILASYLPNSVTFNLHSARHYGFSKLRWEDASQSEEVRAVFIGSFSRSSGFQMEALLCKINVVHDHESELFLFRSRWICVHPPAHEPKTIPQFKKEG